MLHVDGFTFYRLFWTVTHFWNPSTAVSLSWEYTVWETDCQAVQCTLARSSSQTTADLNKKKKKTSYLNVFYVAIFFFFTLYLSIHLCLWKACSVIYDLLGSIIDTPPLHSSFSSADDFVLIITQRSVQSKQYSSFIKIKSLFQAFMKNECGTTSPSTHNVKLQVKETTSMSDFGLHSEAKQEKNWKYKTYLQRNASPFTFMSQ